MQAPSFMNASAITHALPMLEAIDAVKMAFTTVSQQQEIMPQRMRVELAKGDTLLMPACLPGVAHAYVMKAVSIFPENPKQGLPTCPGIVLCLCPETGTVKTLMDAHALTTLRTGAAGGLSAQYLAREDARVLTCIGCGDQARGQIEGIFAVKNIKRLILAVRNVEKALPFAKEILKRHGIDPEINANIDQAVAQADIVVAATSSKVPVFSADAIKPGTHVISVGSYRSDMAEIPADLVRQARVFVDQIAAARAEAGDLLQAGVEPSKELGQVILGQVKGRENDQQITFFKSVGLAVQDAAVAASIIKKTQEKRTQDDKA